MNNRKDAVQAEYSKQSEIIFKDRKGTWKAGFVWRNMKNSKHIHFEIQLAFIPNLERLPCADPAGYSDLVFMRQDDDILRLKKRIKSYIGYTPDKETIYVIWDRLGDYKKHYAEEDRFYASCDKEAAKLIMKGLIETATGRFQAGKEIEILTDTQMERFLTRSEIEEASEAQKVLNGFSYVDANTHLQTFNQTIDNECTWLKNLKEKEEELKRKDWHQELLETNVAFRRFVALVLHAKKEIRSNNLEHEVAQSLFGYCSSFYDYRDHVLPHFRDLMSLYRLQTYEIHKLLVLGNEYVQEGGILPIPMVASFRVEGKFYYGDYIHDGIDGYVIESVRLKYVYTKHKQLLKTSVKYYEYIPYIENPTSTEEHLQNERIQLNNFRSIPNAHLLSLDEIIHRISSKRKTYRRLPCPYAKRIENERDPLKREALQYLSDGLRVIELRKQLNNLKPPLHTQSIQESYNRVFQELESTEKRLPYTLSS